jgi:hypothetical protein
MSEGNCCCCAYQTPPWWVTMGFTPTSQPATPLCASPSLPQPPETPPPAPTDPTNLNAPSLHPSASGLGGIVNTPIGGIDAKLRGAADSIGTAFGVLAGLI